MVQALATGTTVSQDRINRPSGGSCTSTLHLAPCLGEMRCTMRRVSNLRGHTTFTSFSSDLLLPLNSTIHNIVSPIPQNILSYTKYTSNIYPFSFQQTRLYNQLLKTNMIQQQLDYCFFISFWSFLIFFLFFISCIIVVYSLFNIVWSFLNFFCIFAYSLFCFAFLHLFYLFLFDSSII